jgi:uncharacterized membrane protein
MWIIDWLPDWIFYAIFLVGVIGLFVSYLIKRIPIVYIYKTPLQIISIVFILVGSYLSGAISNEEKWQTRVKELEAKVSKAEAEAQRNNVKIVEKIVVQKELIQENAEQVTQYINKEVTKHDTKFSAGECEIPKEFVKSLNDAAEVSK